MSTALKTNALTLWQECLSKLRDEIPAQKFSTWIRPLHAENFDNVLILLAPNQFVMDWINEHYLVTIKEIMQSMVDAPPEVRLQIGTKDSRIAEPKPTNPSEKEGNPGGLSGGLILIENRLLGAWNRIDSRNYKKRSPSTKRNYRKIPCNASENRYCEIGLRDRRGRTEPKG